MQKIGFSEALDELVAACPNYHREAYIFVRDALDYTTKKRKKAKDATSRHVNGGELLDGVRELALDQFGPMVPTVFDFWGIRSCADIGRIVFNLIEIGVFGKTERDSIDDFSNGYDFHEAFVRPFIPTRSVPGGEVPSDDPAQTQA